MILLYSVIILCVLAVMAYCAISAYLLLTDAVVYRKDKITAAISGIIMALASAAAGVVFVWLLNHPPL